MGLNDKREGDEGDCTQLTSISPAERRSTAAAEEHNPGANMDPARQCQVSGEGRSYLGALAPEVVDIILTQVDSVRDLGNFVTTCHFVHQCFEARREPLIHRVLQNELGPVLTDARFLRIFHYADPSGPLHLRHGRRLRPDLCQTLHRMNFLANIYITAQRRSFGDSVGGVGGEDDSQSQSQATAPPSRTERLRVLRAFYRRHISRTRPPHQGVPLGLYAAMEPWELQQVDHADHFVTRLCAALRGALACPGGRDAAAVRGGRVRRHLLARQQFGEVHAGTPEARGCRRPRPAVAAVAQQERELSDAAPAYSQFADRYSLLCFRLAFQANRAEWEASRTRRGSNASPPFGWVDGLDGRYVNWFAEALGNIPWLDLPGDEEAYRARNFCVHQWRGAGLAMWDRKRVEAIKELDPLRTFHTGWIVH
ncbi:hypothetical protein VMCG_08254 [Cytospora schulzeri]|uniref:Uncharacterized protein n=1 Tax=Cytospora schulzeri TaxID=448051 RepID=A0A423VSK2_9PEZI|nr:hypothetical protein VMCG_08254 [Valsa malicola]